MITFSTQSVEVYFEINQFPNGEQNLLLSQGDVNIIKKADAVEVAWFYKDDSEFLTVVFLLSKIRELNPSAKLVLSVPYLPYARMDRIEKETQFFTLSYFLDQMVTLGVDELHTLDVHSFKASELLNNRVRFVNKSVMNRLFDAVRTKYANSDMVAVFPDETAKKRFEGFIKDMPSITIKKKREFETGKLIGFEVDNPDNIDLNGKVLIMVDDLCSYGGTFLGGYKAIKDTDVVPKGFALLVTHLEESVFNGKLLPSKDLLGIWFAPTFDWNNQANWQLNNPDDWLANKRYGNKLNLLQE